MKECLHCKKEYEPKRAHSKFCSTSCRVMYNRNHPKETVSKFQMQVLYNNILAAVDSINAKNGQPEAIGAVFSQPKSNTPIVPKYVPQVAKEAIMRKYVEDRRDCSGKEEFENWLDKLNADDRLTTKEKELVKNTR